MGTNLFPDLVPRISDPVSRSKQHSLAMLHKNKAVSGFVPKELKNLSNRKKSSYIISAGEGAKNKKGGKYEG